MSQCSQIHPGRSLQSTSVTVYNPTHSAPKLRCTLSRYRCTGRTRTIWPGVAYMTPRWTNGEVSEPPSTSCATAASPSSMPSNMPSPLAPSTTTSTNDADAVASPEPRMAAVMSPTGAASTLRPSTDRIRAPTETHSDVQHQSSQYNSRTTHGTDDEAGIPRTAMTHGSNFVSQTRAVFSSRTSHETVPILYKTASPVCLSVLPYQHPGAPWTWRRERGPRQRHQRQHRRQRHE